VGASYWARNDGREVPDLSDALFHYFDFHVNLSSTMKFHLFTRGDSLLGAKEMLTLFVGEERDGQALWLHNRQKNSFFG
jgi:hypothetical protein